LIIDLDEALLIRCDRCSLQAKIVGVGLPANSEQEMGTDDLRRSFLTFDISGNIIAALGNSETLGVEAYSNPFALQYVTDRR